MPMTSTYLDGCPEAMTADENRRTPSHRGDRVDPNAARQRTLSCGTDRESSIGTARQVSSVPLASPSAADEIELDSEGHFIVDLVDTFRRRIMCLQCRAAQESRDAGLE